MKKLDAGLDLDQEANQMAHYIALKWAPFAGLEQMFLEIRDAALNASRAWLEPHTLALHAYKLADERLRQLMGGSQSLESVQTAVDYDAVSHFLNSVALLERRISAAGRDIDGPWDYERRVRRLCGQMLTKYPGLAAARPKGWEDLSRNYTDFEGQEDYDPGPDRLLFKGSCAEGAVTGDFVVRTALPYVMYDEKCQSRKAHEVLIGAVYGQFLTVRAWLNTQQACSALSQATAAAPAGFASLWSPTVVNPHLKVMMSMMRPTPGEDAYREAVAASQAWARLSPSEQAKRRTASDAEVDQLTAENLCESAEQKHEADAKTQRAMRVVF